jgi:hypothetical protein
VPNIEAIGDQNDDISTIDFRHAKNRVVNWRGDERALLEQ